jgi:hypothetical protein
MPVGPHILWPLNARKSQPISCTSIGNAGTLSGIDRVTMPSWRARSHSATTGFTVPNVGNMGHGEYLDPAGEKFIDAIEVQQSIVASNGCITNWAPIRSATTAREQCCYDVPFP